MNNKIIKEAKHTPDIKEEEAKYKIYFDRITPRMQKPSRKKNKRSLSGK